MWVNTQYEVDDAMRWLRAFVEENTLSTIVAHEPVSIAHMPVELIEDGPGPRLLFHVPKVDPIAEALTQHGLVTVVVHGPQQYISPSLYRDIGLPTFNYGVAEVTDLCTVLHPGAVREHLLRLTEEREQRFARVAGTAPWQMHEAAVQRFDRLLPLVTGFEVPLARMQLKLKMGQNRSADDRRHTSAALRSTAGTDLSVPATMDSMLDT